jgi:hypothetical protein
MAKKNTRWVKDCCQEAIDQVNVLGFVTTINAKTLSYWCINFQKRGQFAHLNPFVANGIKPSLHCLNVSQRRQWMHHVCSESS